VLGGFSRWPEVDGKSKKDSYVHGCNVKVEVRVFDSFATQKYALLLNFWRDPTAVITHTSEPFSRMLSQVKLSDVEHYGSVNQSVKTNRYSTASQRCCSAIVTFYFYFGFCYTYLIFSIEKI